MELHLSRDFVCSADDQSNNSELDISIKDNATISDFLKLLLSIDYLQYSSSHCALVAKSEIHFAIVIPEDREIIFLVEPDTLISEIAPELKIKFEFDLNQLKQSQRRLYSEYCLRKVTSNA